MFYTWCWAVHQRTYDIRCVCGGVFRKHINCACSSDFFKHRIVSLKSLLYPSLTLHTSFHLNAFIRLAYRKGYVVAFLINVDVGGTIQLWCNHGQVNLGSPRKAKEHDYKSKPSSSVLLWPLFKSLPASIFLFESLSWLLSIMDYDHYMGMTNNLFLSQFSFDWGITRTVTHSLDPLCLWWN